MRPRAGDVVRYLRERAHDVEFIGEPDPMGLCTAVELAVIAKEQLLKAADIVEAAAKGEVLRFKR